MIRFAGSLLLLVATSIAIAGDYSYSNGYFYNSSGQAFVRSQVWNRWNYCYTYTAVPTATYVAPVTAYATPTAIAADWRTKILDLAIARDKGILAERASALDQAQYLETINALGLKGNFTINGYGQNVAYGNTNFAQSYSTYSQASPFFAPQASTVYGYAYQNTATAWGDVDVNSMIQSYARAVERAQNLGGQSVTDLGALTDQELGRRLKILEATAKIQEIRAKGDAFAAAMKALEEKKVVIQQSGTGTIPVPVNPPAQVPAPQQTPAPATNQVNDQHNDALDKLGNLMESKCGDCHNSTTKKGGLDLTLWRSFDQAKKNTIRQRLVSTDPEKLMPRTKDGGPGQRLGNDDIQLFLSN